MKKKDILKELIRGIYMPSFCDEEGRCDAIEECTTIDAKECSCCNINHIIKAFNKGIEFQKQNSPWINVEEDLPCNHEELIHFDLTNNVLVIDDKQNIFIAFMKKYKDNEWIWDSTNNFVFLPLITHWMPIPKLQK